MSIRVVVTANIDKPIEDVWSHFTDFEFNAEVDTNTASAKLIGGRARSKGAVWQLLIKSPLGGTVKEIQTVTEWDPPYRYAAEVSRSRMAGPEYETFDIAPDGSVDVTWEAVYELSGVMRLLTWVLPFIIKRGSRARFAAMKQAIEFGEPTREKGSTA